MTRPAEAKALPHEGAWALVALVQAKMLPMAKAY